MPGIDDLLGSGWGAFQQAKQQKLSNAMAERQMKMQEDEAARNKEMFDLKKGQLLPGGNQGEAFDQAGKLRNEYINQSKPFAEQTASFRRIQAVTFDRPDSPEAAAGDLALIFNYMKILDPGSVVREGEFATAQNTAGVPDRIRNAYNNTMAGVRLTPGQRNAFKQQAGNMYSAALKLHKTREGEYTRLAQQYSLKPENVILRFENLRPEELEQFTKSAEIQKPGALQLPMKPGIAQPNQPFASPKVTKSGAVFMGEE